MMPEPAAAIAEWLEIWAHSSGEGDHFHGFTPKLDRALAC